MAVDEGRSGSRGETTMMSAAATRCSATAPVYFHLQDRTPSQPCRHKRCIRIAAASFSVSLFDAVTPVAPRPSPQLLTHTHPLPLDHLASCVRQNPARNAQSAPATFRSQSHHDWGPSTKSRPIPPFDRHHPPTVHTTVATRLARHGGA